MTIRPLTKKDKPAVMQILHNTREFKPFEVVVAEEVIDCYLQDPTGSGYHVLVAEADSPIVGYVSYGPAPITIGTWDVYWIAVSLDKQGQGIGSGLMAYVENEIKKAQGRLIIIETSSMPLYDKTRRFYLDLGYEIISRIPDFYVPGDDKVTFQKRLS